MSDPSLDFYELDEREFMPAEQDDRDRARDERLSEYAPFAELVRAPYEDDHDGEVVVVATPRERTPVGTTHHTPAYRREAV